MTDLRKKKKQFKFRYMENYTTNRMKDSINNGGKPLDEVLQAKNTDGKWVTWICRMGRTIFVVGNTDNLNIWLYRTRKDLSAELIIDFANQLNAWAAGYGWSISLSSIVDPEDWQEIAHVSDAGEDPRYK